MTQLCARPTAMLHRSALTPFASSRVAPPRRRQHMQVCAQAAGGDLFFVAHNNFKVRSVLRPAAISCYWNSLLEGDIARRNLYSLRSKKKAVSSLRRPGRIVSLTSRRLQDSFGLPCSEETKKVSHVLLSTADAVSMT